MFDTQSQFTEAQEKLNARNRIEAALNVFLSQVAGEVQAKNVDRDVEAVAKAYAHDMLAEIDGCLDIPETIEAINAYDGYDVRLLPNPGVRA